MQAYRNKPDILELVVGRSFLDKLSIKRVAYPFGESTEEYCYFNDILIGEVAGDAELSKFYYRSLNVPCKDREVIKLTPMISKNEYLLCPNCDVFRLALSSLLNTSNNFVLICEADCDQNKVEENPDMKQVLDQLQGFCQGEHYDCPTFIWRNEI